MEVIMIFLTGVMVGMMIPGLAMLSPLFFRKEKMPTKEEWKAGGRQSWY